MAWIESYRLMPINRQVLMKTATVVIQPTKHTADAAEKRHHGDEEHDKQNGHSHYPNTDKSFYALYK